MGEVWKESGSKKGDENRMSEGIWDGGRKKIVERGWRKAEWKKG